MCFLVSAENGAGASKMRNITYALKHCLQPKEDQLNKERKRQTNKTKNKETNG